ncbi:hypothetical protein AM571_PA00132 (plasmid) [Rhizobium etli 8C-3]|uniref:Uncharacterized protein n=1 Tax=Rhizobium etli 8C-3 TaxID=538025 RepID=A0A1L5PA11_RHIET|nr:hypothetical protein AM571_PA00132 [Rhizobium etli 8C-3]
MSEDTVFGAIKFSLESSIIMSAMYISIFLGTCVPSPANANVAPINVHKKPEYFVNTLINNNLVEEEFLTCLDRIKRSRSFNDDSCIYTLGKFNKILARLRYGQIKASETVLFTTILEMISQRSTQKSGANR